ncbi:hypothetical protein HQ585_10335 [candidate division KSB1 bacterium]|nr:hypothetical protein [candidate division KSB1 bacterium]
MKSIYWKTQTSLLIIFGVLFISLHCSDPLSEEQKETLVRTLVEGQVGTGNYSIFWDGRDDQDKLVSAGTYICNFHSRDYGNQVTMTALAGGSDEPGDYNDSTVYAAPPDPVLYTLDQNSPNPFYIKEGTNIVFSIPFQSAVLITIHKEE